MSSCTYSQGLSLLPSSSIIQDILSYLSSQSSKHTQYVSLFSEIETPYLPPLPHCRSIEAKKTEKTKRKKRISIIQLHRGGQKEEKESHLQVKYSLPSAHDGLTITTPSKASAIQHNCHQNCERGRQKKCCRVQ